MDKVRIPSGGMRSNVRAGETIEGDRLFKYSSTTDEIVKCGSGGEADGIVLATVESGSIVNNDGGTAYSRKTSGVYDNITYSGSLTVGNEWMSNGSGQVVAYVVAGDNRPLGKVLALNDDDSTAKLSFYAK